MEWNLYRQQQSYRKTEKQQNQFLENNQTSVLKKIGFFLKESNKSIFFIKNTLDPSQFSDANKTETILSAIAKLLHKAEDNTPSKVQETLELKMTIAKKTSISTNL